MTAARPIFFAQPPAVTLTHQALARLAPLSRDAGEGL
jgi:hypothetical protein